MPIDCREELCDWENQKDTSARHASPGFSMHSLNVMFLKNGIDELLKEYIEQATLQHDG